MKRIVLSRVDRQVMRDIPRIASICLGGKTFTNVTCTAAEYKVCITKGTISYEFALPRFSTETDTFQSALIQNIREFANANKLYMVR